MPAPQTLEAVRRLHDDLRGDLDETGTLVTLLAASVDGPSGRVHYADAGHGLTVIAGGDAPVRWLEAISRTRAGVSGGPNFAYDLCVRSITPEQRATLDLTSWGLALNRTRMKRSAGIAPLRNRTSPGGSTAWG